MYIILTFQFDNNVQWKIDSYTIWVSINHLTAYQKCGKVYENTADTRSIFVDQAHVEKE